MDYLYDLDFGKFRNKETTLPMSNFFNRYELNINRKKCKKIEELIEKYSLDSYLIIEKGKNKSLLLKVLYDINKDNLLKCFSKNT